MNRFLEYLDKRLPIMDAHQLLAKKEVPVHKYSLFYYLGGICLYLVIVQFVTGILLLFYYQPTEELAFESVKFIMTKVSFGWLVRSVHSWSANLLVGALFVHLFSTFLLKAYRPPRELTWMTGMSLLMLSLGLCFTGYLLPWNELAYFATKIGTEMSSALPIIGETVKEFLRGGQHVTGVTLTRFFAFHIWILPLSIMFLIGIHLLLVQKLGMSRPLSQSMLPKKSMPFFPHFALRDLNVWLIVLAVLIALSFYFPAHLGEPADPLSSTPIGIQPEWYFLFMFQALKIIPSHVFGMEGEMLGLGGFAVAGILLFLVPFLDRRAAAHQASLLFTIIGWFMIAAFLFFTIWGVLE